MYIAYGITFYLLMVLILLSLALLFLIVPSIRAKAYQLAIKYNLPES